MPKLQVRAHIKYIMEAYRCKDVLQKSLPYAASWLRIHEPLKLQLEELPILPIVKAPTWLQNYAETLNLKKSKAQDFKTLKTRRAKAKIPHPIGAMYSDVSASQHRSYVISRRTLNPDVLNLSHMASRYKDVQCVVVVTRPC